MHVLALMMWLIVAGLLVCALSYQMAALWCVRRRLTGNALAARRDADVPSHNCFQNGEALNGHALNGHVLNGVANNGKSHNLAPAPCAPVSILKPLKGDGSDLLDNISTFAVQDFPRYEILFGVADIDDPAVAVVRQLQQKFPDCDIRLIVAPKLGMNPKSAILHALADEAKYEVFALSDSDIHVRPDYLRRLTAPLCDPTVGLVTCMYVAGAAGVNPAGVLDALHIDQAFLPLAAVGSFVPGVRYAFGASIALRKGDLCRAGGYAAIADQLADDYMVGQLICKNGMQTRLADFTVAHSVADTSFRALWQRELRWARTIRVLEGRRYAALPVTFWIIWAILLAILAGGAVWALAIGAAAVAIRLTTALATARLIGSPRRRRELLLLPLRDLMDAAIWCAAWTGSRVTWRDICYRLLPDGRLAPMPQPVAWPSIGQSVPVIVNGSGGATHATVSDGHALRHRRRPALASRIGRAMSRPFAVMFRGMVGWIDSVLRAREGIFEFTDDPTGLLRIGLQRSTRRVDLQDGTILEPGDRFIELHFWNEHFMKLPRNADADLAWAKVVRDRMVKSLKSLAHYLEKHENLRDVPAIFGRTAMVTRSPKQFRTIIRHFGFEIEEISTPRNFFQRLHDRGEDLLIRALLGAFSPFSRRLGSGPLPRHEVWMSRTMLLERYGSTAEQDGAGRSARQSRKASKRARAFGRDAAERHQRHPQAVSATQSVSAAQAVGASQAISAADAIGSDSSEDGAER